MLYNREIPEYGDVMTVDDFRDSVKVGAFIDYDGNGNPAKLVGGHLLMSDQVIIPSRLVEIPLDATHIVWYNR